jgi:hypothetical protein
MGAVVALDRLLAERTVWLGRAPPRTTPDAEPTGIAALDAALPFGGWPPSAISEILTPMDGIGELSLLFPTLARLTQAKQSVAIVAPPYLPYAPAWHLAGVDLDRLLVVRAERREALWSAEQCLRSAACAAVLCWPVQANDKAMRRLQVAAETGRALGFAFRSDRVAENPSPAALRLKLETRPRRVRVIKCRGANPPAGSIALPAFVVH